LAIKFLNFLEAADGRFGVPGGTACLCCQDQDDFRAVATGRVLGEARQTEPFDPSVYEDEGPEVIEMERKSELRRSAADLLLVERAKEWLLED